MGITPICCGLLPRHAGSGDLLSETRSFGDKFDAVDAHLPSAENLRKRAEHLRNFPQKASKTAVKRRPPRNRTKSGPIAP
jgi:hypothetical protein